MSKADQVARYSLPDVVDPTDTICFVVPVPADKFHVAAFKGQIKALASAYAWGNDEAHTALAVAAVWREIFDNLERCKPCPPPSGDQAGADEGGEDMIRQNPDNPCELQSSINGTVWCTWADLSLCIPAGGQPGGGSEQPPAGGSACYQGTMPANSQSLLPTVVSAGDILTISNLTGAAGDAPFGNWTCPDGTAFLLGVCVPSTGGHDGGDPMPAALHGAIICSIDGTWYDITAGPVTVPGGVSSVPVYLQMNDSDITNNQGSYGFKICVDNNTPAEWTSELDFRANSYASIMNSVDYATTWVAGSGYEGGFVDANSLHVSQVNVGIDSAEITSLSLRYSGGGSSGPNGQVQTRINIYAAYGTPGAVGSGTNLLYGQINDITGITALIPGVNSGTTDAQVIIHSLRITGRGPKPSQLP